MNLKIYTINKLYKVSRTCKGKNNTSRIIFAITWYFLQREFEIYTVQGFENIFKEKKYLNNYFCNNMVFYSKKI
jgi:uncharacterized protein (DUF608 family)